MSKKTKVDELKEDMVDKMTGEFGKDDNFEEDMNVSRCENCKWKDSDKCKRCKHRHRNSINPFGPYIIPPLYMTPKQVGSPPYTITCSSQTKQTNHAGINSSSKIKQKKSKKDGFWEKW